MFYRFIGMAVWKFASRYVRQRDGRRLRGGLAPGGLGIGGGGAGVRPAAARRTGAGGAEHRCGGIPRRAQRRLARTRLSAVWRNWAGDQQCVPAAIERPGSVEELQAVVRTAAGRGQKV